MDQKKRISLKNKLYRPPKKRNSIENKPYGSAKEDINQKETVRTYKRGLQLKTRMKLEGGPS